MVYQRKRKKMIWYLFKEKLGENKTKKEKGRHKLNMCSDLYIILSNI